MKRCPFWKPTFNNFILWPFWCCFKPPASVQCHDIEFTRVVLQIVFGWCLNMGKGCPFWKPTFKIFILWLVWCCCKPPASVQCSDIEFTRVVLQLFLKGAKIWGRGAHFEGHNLKVSFCDHFGVVANPLHQSNAVTLNLQEWFCNCFWKVLKYEEGVPSLKAIIC